MVRERTLLKKLFAFVYGVVFLFGFMKINFALGSDQWTARAKLDFIKLFWRVVVTGLVSFVWTVREDTFKRLPCCGGKATKGGGGSDDEGTGESPLD